MIRFKVFLPALAFIALISFLVIYKLDFWVKTWIEEGISSITETKTDIRNLRLSFRNSSLEIDNLQIASKEDEFKNAVELENITVAFEALPLLKKRVVVDRFSVTGIEWGTRRKTSGRLPPQPKKYGKSWFSEVASKSIASLKKEAENLPVNKLLDFRVPTDVRDVLGSVNLQSEEAYKSSVLASQEAQSKWKSKMEDLRDLSEYNKQFGEAKALTENLPSNPQEILSRAEQLQRIIDFFNSEKQKSESLLKDVQADSQKLQEKLSSAQSSVNSDFERAKKLVSLDSLNVDNLSRMIFGPQWIGRAEQILKLRQGIRDYLAKSSPKPNVQVQQRAHGRDIVFVVPRAQPSFVLASSEFSVKGLVAGQKSLVSQVYDLKFKDINSAPRLYGKPSSVDFSAKLNDMIIGGVHFLGFWDYTKEPDKDDYKVEVEKIRATSWPVGIPKVFPIKIVDGTAEAKSELAFNGDDMDWKSHIQFHDVNWDTNEISKQGILIPILEDVFGQVKSFYLDLEMKSVNGGLDYKVSSDLDSMLKAGILKAIDKQWQDFQDKLHHEIELRVSRYREDAEKEISQFKSGVEGKATAYVGEATKYMSDTIGLQNSLKQRASEVAQGQMKKSLGGALKLPKNPPLKLPKF